MQSAEILMNFYLKFIYTQISTQMTQTEKNYFHVLLLNDLKKNSDLDSVLLQIYIMES